MTLRKEWVLRAYDVQAKNGGRIRVSETQGRFAVRIEVAIGGPVQVTNTLAVELSAAQWRALCDLGAGWGDKVEVEDEPEMVTQIRAAGLDVSPEDDIEKANGTA